jgi:hypothetical protein
MSKDRDWPFTCLVVCLSISALSWVVFGIAMWSR